MKIIQAPSAIWKRYPLVIIVIPAIIFFVVAASNEASTPVHNFAREAAWVYGLLAVIGLFGVPRLYRVERERRSGIETIDDMTGIDFEHRLTDLFRSLGYSVTPTQQSGDFGADHILERDAIRSVVQAKRYNNPVGIEAVYQVVGSKAHYAATRAIVVTNSSFTPAAVTLAEENEVILIDRIELIELLSHQARRNPSMTGFTLLSKQLVAGIRPAAKYTLGVAIVALFFVATWCHAIMSDPNKRKSPLRQAGRFASNYATITTGKRIFDRHFR